MVMTPIDIHAMTSICLNLREEDKREILSVRRHDCLLTLAGEAYTALVHYGRGKIAWHKGVPAAVIGFYEMRPNVWDAVSFGTEHYKDVGIHLMREGRAIARDLLTEVGANRLQADSRSDNIQAHAFIKALGGKPEFTMRYYGRDGSDYIRFVWLTETDRQLVIKETA